MDDTLTTDGWWMLVENKRATAEAMVENRQHCREAWQAAGFAVEFALKAVIMKRKRFNQWPSKAAEPELHTHNIRLLIAKAEIELKHVPADIRGKCRTVMDWEREHDYLPGKMPRSHARAMVDAAFGKSGVIEWLKSL